MSVPWSERVPPLIFRLVTRCRRLRSPALFSEGTSGSATKTNNSLMKRSMRRQSLPWTAKGSSRKGRHRASNFRSNSSWARRRFPCLGMGEALGLGVEVVHCRGPSGQLGVFGVERLQVMDVPEQMGPTPLLRTRIVVIRQRRNR